MIPRWLRLPEKFAENPSKQVSMPFVLPIKLEERAKPEPTRTVLHAPLR